MRITIVILAVTVVVGVLAGCTAWFGGDRVGGDGFGGDHGGNERFVRPGHPQPSPSGEFVAHGEFGPERNGVQTWIVVITERGGSEVFRDTDAYSSRHGVGITWLTDTDELWILSTDVGTSYVQQDADGTWSKEHPRLGHYEDDVPAEIRKLEGR